MDHTRICFYLKRKKTCRLPLALSSLFLQGDVLPQVFMYSYNKKKQIWVVVFSHLCSIFWSTCCSRSHPESRVVQPRVQRVILARVLCSLTDHITRGHESSLSYGTECSRTATPRIMPENIVSFVQFLQVLEQNTKKEVKESPGFVCNLDRHLCTHQQDIQANSKLSKYNI